MLWALAVADRLQSALLLLAALAWLFSAVGWARVFRAGGDDMRREALRQLALVMAITSAVTAAAAASWIW